MRHAFSYPSVRGSLEHNRAALARFVDALPARACTSSATAWAR